MGGPAVVFERPLPRRCTTREPPRLCCQLGPPKVGGLPAGSNTSVVQDLATVGLAVSFDQDGVTVTVTA
ncbi:MAG: hypothetical protein FWC87_04395 [Acidimicrobiaceae bacterium]|nr:hypothetical protein [Acidimicrobiaceae bacterium]